MQTLVQSAFLQSLGWAIVQSTWQITLLWLAYFLLSRVFLKGKHKARISLGMFTMLGGFIWFVTTVAAGISRPETMNMGGVSVVLKTSYWLATLAPWLSASYLLLLLAGTVRFVRSIGYVQSLQKEQFSKMPYEWRLFTAQTAIMLGMKRKVSIWLSELADSPVTVGFLKPMILIPVSMLNQLSTGQTEAIILHELAHIKRNDYLLNILLTLMEGLLFFHPFVHLLGKEIRKDREFLCDDLVLQFRYNPSQYAAALLQAEKNRIILQHNRLRLAAIGEKDALMERVSRITNLKVRKRNTRKPVVILVMLVVFGSFVFNTPYYQLPVNKLSTTIEVASPQGTDRGYNEYPLAMSSWMPERSETMPDAAEEVRIEKEELAVTTEQTGFPLPDASENFLTDYINNAPATTLHSVSGHEYKVEIDGVEWTGKLAASAAGKVEAEVKKPFEIALARDSTAFLLYNLVQGEYRKAFELGNLRAFLNKMDWEKIAHEQASGAEAIHLMELEIANTLKDMQWEQLKNQQELEKQHEALKVLSNKNKMKADSLLQQMKKKERKIIHL